MAKKEPRLRVLDTGTGEVFSDFDQIWIPRRAKIKEGWFMAMQEGFLKLAKTPMRGQSVRVLFFLMGRLDYENFVRQSRQEIGDSLGMPKGNVSRAIKELRENGILDEAKDKSLRLNTKFGWRGKVSNLNKFHLGELKKSNTEAADEAARAPLPEPLCV